MTVTLNLPDDLAARLLALPDPDGFISAVLAAAFAAEDARRDEGRNSREAARQGSGAEVI